MSANESLGRAQELAERLRAKLDGLEQLADAGDVDAALCELGQLVDVARKVLGRAGRGERARQGEHQHFPAAEYLAGVERLHAIFHGVQDRLGDLVADRNRHWGYILGVGK